MKNETKMWLDLAHEDDIDMMIMLREKRYRATVIFAQQKVEKALKAYITEHSSHPPKKTHFIEKLIEEAKLDTSEIGSPEVELLSIAYAWARYRDISLAHFKTEKDVIHLVAIANSLYQWITHKLKKT